MNMAAFYLHYRENKFISNKSDWMYVSLTEM